VALVELRSLTHRFAGADAPVLDGVDLDVEAGESLAVVGPSGSGKSTLLNVIGALLPPTAGVVRLAGQDLASLDADGLARLRNRQIGFVFQAHHLLPQCTALENVLVPTLALPRAERAGKEARARELLAAVGLAARVDAWPASLSGGECQRVAVVRALIQGPRLVLADEPTGSLDAASADALADLLCELNDRAGTALIAVTHSDRLAARMQRTLELRDGKLHATGVRA
jgi:lipoprotein-releasing system ATP-binding protein